MQTKLVSGNQQGTHQMGHLGLNKKIILKCIAEDEVVRL